MSSTPDAGQSQSQSQSQLQSQGQACDRCHRRKTKCDKRRPACLPCQRKRLECVYSERNKEPVYRRSFVERLERRINGLEAANKRLEAVNKRLCVVASGGATADLALNPDLDAAPGLLADDIGSHAGAAATTADDVANEVSFMSTRAGSERHYLGSASGILLASLMTAGVSIAPERPIEAVPSAVAANAGLGGPRWSIGDEALPPEQLSRSLVEAYLAHDHLSYPFLHPRAVRATVDRVYSDAAFLRTHAFEAFMFNMVLAVATSQAYKFDWMVLPDAETHYQRSMVHLNTVLCDGGLRALQALLLMCQFRLTSSTKATSGSLWHIVGIAARICFELGLHREAMYRLTKSSGPQAEISYLSPRFEENEVRRRCFWSVFALDRVVSITLGRPLAICLEDIDVELPTEDLDEATNSSVGSICGDQGSPRIPPSYRTALFVHLVRYRNICGRCLTSLHRSNRAALRPGSDIHQTRDKLAEELRSWRADTDQLNLPDVDLLTPLVEARSSFRSKAWYELLYNNGVLLLYRPSPSTVSASDDSLGLQQVFSAAKQSITLYAYLLRSRKINFSWFTMHSVFMAGLSYVYVLSRHFRDKRLCLQGHGIQPFQLTEEPLIVDIVNSCRACSNVLVAVSERCNAQKNCHEVFDRLSDAVLTDVVAASTTQPMEVAGDSSNLSRRYHTRSAPQSHAEEVGMGLPNVVASDHQALNGGFRGSEVESGRQGMLSGPSLAVENALKDCFTELQDMYDAQWGDDAILQLSTDWLDAIDSGNGLEMSGWNLEP